MIKDLKRQIRTPTKFTKRLISILPTIVAVTAVFVIFLWTTIPPGPENDIPNWMTMTVELGIGFFIAALIFILQEKLEIP